MKPSLWECLCAAFNARPIGMLAPPNWIGLGLFGMLGLLNPGFWVLGAGLEAAYLYLVALNPRFQRLVGAIKQSQSRRGWEERRGKLLAELSPEDLRRYRALEQRCREILEQQMRGAADLPGLAAQSEGLGRLLWIYLRLLLTRRAIQQIVLEAESAQGERLQKRAGRLEEQLRDAKLGEELRKSLGGQLEILKQRLDKQREARHKLDFLEAELTRMQEQVELIREQAALSTDPESVSQRIDQVTATLDGTTQWISDQQRLYGKMEELLAEPPPVVVAPPQKEGT